MELRIEIEKRSAVPIYAQLRDQIRLLVLRGVLEPGAPMPTVRALAVDLEVNANTVARVYRDLQTEGVLRLERGVGTFVANRRQSRSLGAGDFEAISGKAVELVELSRKAGLRAGEVTQLIENLWKEEHHADR